MEIITAHTNADFDTLGSMVAAKKLYPDARLVFPGSLEKGLKLAFEKIELPRIDNIKDIDLDKVSKLILVDVKQASRIGQFAELVCKPGMEIHIYDHHPATAEDIKGSYERTDRVGSTTTLLTLIIKERGITLAPDEATVLMAGIYEDTGSLTYPSTTTKDYEAASFLLSSGADLNIVADLLRKELTPEEVGLLNEFLHSQTTYTIGGIDIVVAEGYLEKYVADISMLAHKLRDIENIGCLFMLVDSEDRVHIIARSRIPQVNAGLVCKAIGGGGHPTAGSASIKKATLIEAKERLLAALKANLVPSKSAIDIMSFPPITVKAGSTVKEAAGTMKRYNINAAPVINGRGSAIGIITRQVADRALLHGLEGMAVKDCMTTDFDWVSPGTSVEEIRDKVMMHGQRLLPVLEDKKPKGVITRTDLLKLLQEELKEKPLADKRTKDLSRHMRDRLPEWVMEILKQAGKTASALGFKAFLVGGFVRDIVLNIENLDIDIVIEGDGIAFAEAFAREKGLKAKTHTRFRTAVLIFPDGFKIDVATARLEFYEKPGALPTIEQSSLKLDLYRRDFIINTLAIALNPGRFGELIDFFGAQKDLKEKTIRVIHNLSFIEDPTRVLRAVRFSEKFAFRIGKHTLNLLKNAVKLDAFKNISGARVLDELKHILEEETAPEAIKKLHELGILKLIHPKISLSVERAEFIIRAKEALAWHRLLYTEVEAQRWLVMFLALTDPLSEKELLDLSKRLMISGRKNHLVINSRAGGLKALSQISAGHARKDSVLFNLLSGLPVEVILYLIAKAGREPVRKSLSKYITELKDAKPALKGADLKKLGVPEGPRMGEALEKLLIKRLDNELSTKEEEEAFILDNFARKKAGKPI